MAVPVVCIAGGWQVAVPRGIPAVVRFDAVGAWGVSAGAKRRNAAGVRSGHELLETTDGDFELVEPKPLDGVLTSRQTLIGSACHGEAGAAVEVLGQPAVDARAICAA